MREGRWRYLGAAVAREEALKQEHEARQAAYRQAADAPDLIELMRIHGNIEYDVKPPSPGIGLGGPVARSRLCMSPGTDCYMQFTAPLPNWWRRFWTWALLGWVWSGVEERK
jgi:hypothetical protein